MMSNCAACGNPVKSGIVMHKECFELLQKTQQLDNKPLTMEELREMVDEPVYLHSDDYPADCGWAVIKAVDMDEVIFSDGNIFLVSEYGTVWLAYRRKPEEETI